MPVTQEKTFQAEAVLPRSIYQQLTDLRINQPTLVNELTKKRVRREKIAPKGKLNLLAVDHPARLVTKAGDDPMAMGSRYELLARTVSVLQSDYADGVLASIDILDELFLLQTLLPDFSLDQTVLVSSLNRGGLAGSAWELNDPLTGPTAGAIRDWQFDGGKILLRVGLDERDSLATLEACVTWIRQCNQMGLNLFLEPLIVDKKDGHWCVNHSPEKLAKLVGVATALGNSSQHLWLKLPITDRFEQVAEATTCPILLLGGDSAKNPTAFIEQIESTMSRCHNVRGVMLGRNVLFPGEGLTPVEMAKRVHQVVHR